jgi:hypothetical protein
MLKELQGYNGKEEMGTKDEGWIAHSNRDMVSPGVVSH